MLKTRVIPVLLLMNNGLYKTTQFKKPKYVGDPINAIKIFNDKEVDELIILDICASKNKKEPNYKIIEEVASECFMPVCYGGGINNLKQMKKIYELGIEKVSLNSSIINEQKLIKEAATYFGSQSVVVSVDIKKDLFGKYRVFNHVNNKKYNIDMITFLKRIEKSGAGEILINSVDRDCMQIGYDLKLLNIIKSELRIPIIPCGGAGNLEHLKEAKKETGLNAFAAGSMFVYHGKHKAVLISYPVQNIRDEIFEEIE